LEAAVVAADGLVAGLVVVPPAQVTAGGATPGHGRDGPACLLEGLDHAGLHGPLLGDEVDLARVAGQELQDLGFGRGRVPLPPDRADVLDAGAWLEVGLEHAVVRLLDRDA